MDNKRFVVTIAREFGSMGRPIAKKAAEILGIECYDRDIVEETAKRMGMSVSSVSELEENGHNNFFGMMYPLGRGTTEVQDNIFITQQKIVNQFAERESCIIVGRCADYILKNMESAIHIYIYASYENKLRNCINELGMTKEDAEKMIINVDKARAKYHKRYTGYAINDPKYKNMLIDSSLLGIEGTAQLIVDIVKLKFLSN